LIKEQEDTSRWDRARKQLDLSFQSIAKSEELSRQGEVENGG
jgi:hypothetical protein